MPKQTRVLRLALFVEGPPHFDLSGRIHLEKLWNRLCVLSRVTSPLQVIGFSKAQLRKMAHRPEIKDSGTQPLDRLVAQHYDRQMFDRAIIAFDALPDNQEVVPKGCRHEEIDFVLRHFEVSPQLPKYIRAAATRLRAHYATDPAQRKVRDPGPLEILYMWPNFEGLLVCDEPTVKRALVGHNQPIPSKWPTFTPMIRNPDQSVLPQAVECASKAARNMVRGTFKTNKHAWAEYIIRHVRPNSRILGHPITLRLATIAQN